MPDSKQSTQKRQPKSEWGGVSCHTDRDREIAKMWFAGVADDWEGPVKINILTRIDDGRELKLRALFKRPDGTMKELTRTLGRSQFTVRITDPTSTKWA